METVVAIYELTKQFPSSEVYGLTSQMKRAAISIPSNIAEGRRRRTQREFKHFLRIAFGSAGELETQLEIAERLNFGKNEEREKTKILIEEVMKMLNKMSA